MWLNIDNMTAGDKAKKTGQVQAKKQAKKPVHLDPSQGKATQFKPGQSGNPAGRPKGVLNLSTHIQNLLNDEEFDGWVPDARDGWHNYKGAPIKAVIQAQIVRAIAGDPKAFDLLAKYGYGVKIEPPEGGELVPVALVKMIGSGQPKTDSQD